MLTLPTRKDEAWKYTNLAPLGRQDFAEATRPAKPTVPEGVLGVDGAHFVVVNGALDDAFSPANRLPDGVSVHMTAGMARESDLPMVRLNGEGEGLEIRVSGVVSQPIHLVFVSQAEDIPVLNQPRLTIALEEGAVATIVESHVGAGGETVFTNMVTQVFLAERARLNHYRLQGDARTNSHISTVLADVATDGLYEAFNLAVGAALSRNEVRVTLNGEGAEARLSGAYMGDETQVQDSTIFVDHAVAGATSSQVFKGVLDGQARGVFQGKVLVRRDAQRTDGRQLHKALLFSSQAEVDCKPELEIYADDVKCAHGATVGELDDEQLFYLRSRGIAEEDARHLLIEAFLDEAIDQIENEDIKDSFKLLVSHWLKERQS